MKFIVVCGGQGTKIWPYSTSTTPKQFQPILGETSPYKHNVDILLREYEPEDIFIATKEKYLDFIRIQTPQIPEENFLTEPDIRKDRGPGEGLAVLKFSQRYPDEPFMIVQSDCIREPSDQYLVLVQEMARVAEETGKLVTGGLKAEHPIVGIDYLALGKKLESPSGLEIHEIDQFVYRPQTMDEIEHLISKTQIITHSNHMTWYPKPFMEAYKKYKPDWYEALMKIEKILGNKDEQQKEYEIYDTMDKGATEEATMHVMNAQEAISITLPYKWSDIGSWTSLHEYFSRKGQNYVDAEALVLDSQNSIVKADKSKMVVLMGMKDVVVVDTDDALLIMDRSRSPDVGIVLDELRNRGREDLL